MHAKRTKENVKWVLKKMIENINELINDSIANYINNL